MFKLAITLLLAACNSTAFTQERYSILISEIMADPHPPVALPAYKWIELHNVSGQPVNLQNWRLADAGSTTGPLPASVLMPDSFLLVTSSGSVGALSAFGRSVSVTNFLSLRLAGDQVILLSPQGKTIHAMSYDLATYRNAVKAEGGWSLEMIDKNSPCSGAINWVASSDASGGTPGRRNAVAGQNPDLTPPRLVRSYSRDPGTLVAVFSETLDSTLAANAGRYNIAGHQVVRAEALPPFFNQVLLALGTSMTYGQVYTLTASGISDCAGNLLPQGIVKAGLPETAQAGDLVINEILVHPPPGAFDFVELYNNSRRIIDASRLLIANRNSAGQPASMRVLSDSPLYIFPQEYFVVTPDTASLKKQYRVPYPDLLHQLSLPSFPNDKGAVLLVSQQGSVVDGVNYTDTWHFPLISNTQGISLERIAPSGPSNDGSNWTSAAATAGYATPGYKNSQAFTGGIPGAQVEVSPKIFSPDQDGHDDFVLIRYTLPERGFLANVTVFDAAGMPVRSIARNHTLGVEGAWKWDGLGEKNRKIAGGTYIIYIELFNLTGKREQLKKAVVLARRFN